MCNCTDPEMHEARHGLSRREKIARDPGYGDWLYEQEKDRRLEERPPCDSAILKALFDTIPQVFAKEEKGWTGITEKGLRRLDDNE